MEYEKYQYQVLCEDKAHYHFVRGWLEKKGGHRRVFCYGKLPHSGSGKSFVQKHFSEALQKVRQLSSRAKTILIVIVDADNLSTDKVLSLFNHTEEDFVFIVIAKWSIETWVRFLTEPESETNRLDEDKSCKMSYGKNAKYTKLGKQLADMEMTSQSVFPPSLWSSYTRIKNKKLSLGL